MEPGVDQLINLALKEKAITADDAGKLQTLLRKKGGDLDMASSLMVRFHGVPPESAQSLRKRIAAQVATPAPAPGPPSGRVIGKRSESGPAAVEAVTPPAPVSTDASEAAPVDTPAALVVYPTNGAEPTPAQCEAVARLLDLTVYEARYKFREPLPRVAKLGPADELLPIVEALRAAGVDAAAFEQSAIMPALKPFLVNRARFDGSALHLAGPRGEVRVDLTQPVLLVAGRFDFRFQASASLGLKTARGEALDTILFGHLYAGGWTDPLELTELDITDWQFLGGDKGPIARVNFQRTLERIRAPGGATWNDSLLRHASRVKDCTVGFGGGTFDGGSGSYQTSERTNMDGADVLSRVLYHAWRTDREREAVDLEAALSVVSTEPAPEDRVAEAFGEAPQRSASYSPLGGAAPVGRPSARLKNLPGTAGPPGAPPEDSRFSPPPEHVSRAARGLQPRSADGTAACSTCRDRRVVNEFGRCLVCGNFIALPAVTQRSALGWFLKQNAARIAVALVIVFALSVGAFATRGLGAKRVLSLGGMFLLALALRYLRRRLFW